MNIHADSVGVPAKPILQALLQEDLFESEVLTYEIT
jgi:hypothetical protein